MEISPMLTLSLNYTTVSIKFLDYVQMFYGAWLDVRLVVGRPGFDSLAESAQNTLKVDIHSFPV